MNNVSFIISVDSSFDMLSNFFESFLRNDFVKESEIIVVNDCSCNISILNYLNQIKLQNTNVVIINLETKSGYGISNNIGVDNSTNDYLFLLILMFLHRMSAFKKCTSVCKMVMLTVFNHCSFGHKT